jgi:HlyD family secretion protein
MKKWIIVVIVVLVGGFAAWQKWPAWRSDSNAPTGLTGRPTTAVVETRSINFKVSAAGDIGPAEQVSVRPEVNGKIDSLPVDIGDKVKKGEVLFTLDDTDLQIERSSRLTEIEGANLQLAKMERNYKRSKELFDEKLISLELYEDTKTEFELSKNALERAKKTLNLLEDRLSKTKIVAPFDCTVLTRPVSIGQAVSGSGGFNSGTEILTIADLNKMVINAHINQGDVTRLTSGQEVDIQVESVPGLVMKGIVERVAPQSTIKNSIKGYAARILIENRDLRVRPGMTANLSIPIASAENAVAIPLAAVFTEQGERFAYVKYGEGFERRPIQIGISDYDYAEVQSGLNAGDVVSLEDKGAKTSGSGAAKPMGTAAPRAGVGGNATGAASKSAGALSGGQHLAGPSGGSNSTREGTPAGTGDGQRFGGGTSGSKSPSGGAAAGK